MSPDPEAEVDLHRTLDDLPVPTSLFSGLRLADAFAPDNVIFFKRTHTREFAPEGIAANYHHRFVLVVLLEMEGSMRVGNRTHALEPGEAVLIFPFQFHHFIDVSSGELEWLFVTFECNGTDELEPLRDTPRKLDSRSLKRLKRLTERYIEAPVGSAGNPGARQRAGASAAHDEALAPDSGGAAKHAIGRRFA